MSAVCSSYHLKKHQAPQYWIFCVDLPLNWPEMRNAFLGMASPWGSTISCTYTGAGPIFCLLSGVSSDYAQPITGQVTEVTCPVIGRAQPELILSKRQKTGQNFAIIVSVDVARLNSKHNANYKTRHFTYITSVSWRLKHRHHDYLFNSLFRSTTKKTSKSPSLALYKGNQPVPVDSLHKEPVIRKAFPYPLCLHE